jgi:hypothetical protein
MSDPKYGEPIEENTPVETTSVDEAVASAHAGLADAEAASREAAVDAPSTADAEAADAVHTSASAASEQAPQPVVAEPARAESTPATHTEPVYGSSFADDPVDETYVPGAYSSSAETVVVAEPVVPVVRPRPPPRSRSSCRLPSRRVCAATVALRARSACWRRWPSASCTWAPRSACRPSGAR